VYDFTSWTSAPTKREVLNPTPKSTTRKKRICYSNKIRATNKIFVTATKNFTAATKRFAYRTKHFVVVTKCFCYRYFKK